MKEIFNQIICKQCKCWLIPVYNSNNKRFKLYCPNCDNSWSIPVTISLDDGLSLHQENNNLQEVNSEKRSEKL